jgi:hypothetical protein
MSSRFICDGAGAVLLLWLLRARSALLLMLGPLSGGDRWTRTARREAAWMRPVGARTWMCGRRLAATEHAHAGQEARSAPLRGGVLFGDFLWRHGQRKLPARKRGILLTSQGDGARAACWLLLFVTTRPNQTPSNVSLIRLRHLLPQAGEGTASRRDAA